MEPEERVQTLLLLDTYGGLLTPHQMRIMRFYYEEDFSLAEIAQQEGISRQAVHDCIVKATATMNQAEGVLNVQRRESRLRALARQLAESGYGDIAKQITGILEE